MSRGKITTSQQSFSFCKVQFSLFLTFSIVGLGALVSCVNDAVAECGSGTMSWENPGAVVPCSNTDYCYAFEGDLKCDDGEAIVAYKNTNPPNTWCECGPTTNVAQTCSASLQDCGTTIWNKQPNCSLGYKCEPTDADRDVRFCKCD